MPYQYKREPLNDDEVNKLTNACESFEGKFVIWTLLDSGLRVSEFSNLSKDNIQWQEKDLWSMAKVDLMARKQREELYLCLKGSKD